MKLTAVNNFLVVISIGTIKCLVVLRLISSSKSEVEAFVVPHFMQMALSIADTTSIVVEVSRVSSVLEEMVASYVSSMATTDGVISINLWIWDFSILLFYNSKDGTCFL